MILTLPEAKRFLNYQIFSFAFKNEYWFKACCFAHNVSYGNLVTFRIGVALESLQYLNNHEPERFDFLYLRQAAQLIEFGNYYPEPSENNAFRTKEQTF